MLEQFINFIVNINMSTLYLARPVCSGTVYKSLWAQTAKLVYKHETNDVDTVDQFSWHLVAMDFDRFHK